MSRDDLHFRLRIPPDLKDQVQKAAEKNHRSMTAEIVSRLESSFSREYSDAGGLTPEQQTSLAAFIDTIKKSSG